MNPELYKPERFNRLKILGGMAKVAIAQFLDKIDTKLADAINSPDDE